MTRRVGLAGLAIPPLLLSGGAAVADATPTVPGPPLGTSQVHGPGGTGSDDAIAGCTGRGDGTQRCWISIAWQAPAGDGGSPITSYTVTGNESEDPTTVAAETLDLQYDGSSPEWQDEDSSFSVVATNAVGNSVPLVVGVSYVPGPSGATLPPPFRVTARNNGARDDVIVLHVTGSDGKRRFARIDGRQHAFTVREGRARVTVADRNGAHRTTYTVRIKGATEAVTVR